MGFEHIGPFAGPRIAVPQGSGTTTTVSGTGERERQSHAQAGWAAGSVGEEVWRLSCEAVGLPVDVADKDKEKQQEKKKPGKQQTKKHR